MPRRFMVVIEPEAVGGANMYENILERITVDPNIQHGKPCIKNTRTPVYVVLEALSSGMTREEVKTEYPPLCDEDIQTCLIFAALLAKEEELPLTSVP